MTNNDHMNHMDRVPVWPGTMMWTDYHGNHRVHVMTDEQSKDLIAQNVEYLLYDGGQFVGYEYKTEIDIVPETE